MSVSTSTTIKWSGDARAALGRGGRDDPVFQAERDGAIIPQLPHLSVGFHVSPAPFTCWHTASSADARAPGRAGRREARGRAGPRRVRRPAVSGGEEFRVASVVS